MVARPCDGTHAHAGVATMATAECAAVRDAQHGMCARFDTVFDCGDGRAAAAAANASEFSPLACAPRLAQHGCDGSHAVCYADCTVRLEVAARLRPWAWRAGDEHAPRLGRSQMVAVAGCGGLWVLPST